jgi:hypothetical protein
MPENSDLWLSIQTYWAAGGPVMYGLLAIGIVMQAIVLERCWMLFGPNSRSLRRQAAAALTAAGDAVWHQAFLSDATRGLRVLQALVAAAPLVGLLGTVSGMLLTFADLGQAGGADGMARGIGQAMITTQMGLVLALPGLLAHRLLSRRAETMLGLAARQAHVRRSTTMIRVQQLAAAPVAPTAPAATSTERSF